MKTSEDFKRLFEIAKANGLVHTQKQLAQFCGISENSLSRSFNGVEKFLTDGLYRKIEDAIKDAGVSVSGSNSPIQMGNFNSYGIDPKNFASQDQFITTINRLLSMLSEKDKEISQLRNILDCRSSVNNLKLLSSNSFFESLIKILDSAKRFTYIISPYWQMPKNVLDAIKRSSDRGVKVFIIHRDINEPSIQNNSHSHVFDSEQYEKLKVLPNVFFHYCHHLHAKCYFNETTCILTSMNLLESSSNNFELGIIFDWDYNYLLKVNLLASLCSILSQIDNLDDSEINSFFRESCF